MATARWECGTCGLSERLRIVPDCCSACGGSVFSDDYDWRAAEYVEASCLEAQECAYAEDAVPFDPPAADGLILVGLAALVFLAIGVASPSGMEACQATHSFEVCHNTLFR